MSRLTAIMACALLTLLSLEPVSAEVLGVGNFIHVVANLDKFIQFYRDYLRLELTGAPGPRAFTSNAIVSSLYNAPAAQSRVASLKIAGSDMAMEAVEFKDIQSTSIRPRVQDPGATILILTVPDLDAIVARLKKGNVQVLTDGGTPREVLVQDADGFFVKLVQQNSSSNSIGVGFSVTVNDTDKTMRLYREALGFEPHAQPDVQPYRRTTALIPGTTFQMEFLEFKGIDRKSVIRSIHDPGAGVLRLRVRDLDGIVKALQAGGGTIASAGGETVNLGRSRAVILSDPNNLFLQPLESQP